jgi:hypothetical protein
MASMYIARADYVSYSIMRYNLNTNAIDMVQNITDGAVPYAFTLDANYLYASSSGSYAGDSSLIRYNLSTLLPQGRITVTTNGTQQRLTYVSKLLIAQNGQVGYWGVRGVLKIISLSSFTIIDSQSTNRAGVASLVEGFGKIFMAGGTTSSGSGELRLPSNLGFV